MREKAVIAVGYELSGADLAGTPRELVSSARAAEAAGVDYLVLPDRPAAPPNGVGPPAATVTAAVLAARTREIGLVVTAATAYHEPYNLARTIASLDHVSAGRAGWRVVAAPDPEADANHRREGFDPAADRAARAAEYVPLVRDLWDSWEDGAFLHDKETGRFVDGDRVHAVDHAGPTLRVRGPLNVIRPPQGHPVIFAPASDPGVAPAADVLTTARPEPVDRPQVLSVVPFVAATAERARELHAAAGAPRGDREDLVVVGDPAAAVEQVLAALGPSVGVTVRFTAPGQFHAFTDHVLPLLRAATATRTTGPATLRARLGLPVPTNRFAAPAAERS